MSLQKLKSWLKQPPYFALRGKLYAAINAGELSRDTRLDSAISLHTDSLEMVEIVMIIAEHGKSKFGTVGDLLNFLESEDSEYERKRS
jgi:hypothetical protein